MTCNRVSNCFKSGGSTTTSVAAGSTAAFSAGILLWLGTLRIGGDPPGVDAVRTLLNADPGHSRATAARFDIGSPSDDAGVYQMQRMLFVLYRGWVTDSRVWVDA